MTDQPEKLLVSIEDGIKRITINRPERRNSVDRETVQLLGEMRRRKSRYGMVTMCVGGGQGAATIFENLQN